MKDNKVVDLSHCVIIHSTMLVGLLITTRHTLPLIDIIFKNMC